MAVHLTPAIEKRLTALAAQTGRAPEALIEDALARHGSSEGPRSIGPCAQSSRAYRARLTGPGCARALMLVLFDHGTPEGRE